MAREELINSAISFLRDPSVSSAPLQKKISFLQSKNLTKEEIDVALHRAGENQLPPGPGAPPAAGFPPPGGYPPIGYNSYGPGGYWPHAHHHDMQRRDWRDWFIMATVVGGVGYGLYATAKRYLVPLIKPPTPTQLEQDKASIDAEFAKAFALLDQLATDTEAIKASEVARTEKLDKTLEEVEQLVKELRHQDRNRQETVRHTTQSVRELHEAVPAAVTAQLKTHVKPLEDEMKSLRTLIDKRLGSGPTGPATPAPRYPSAHSTTSNGTPAVAAASAPVEAVATPPSQTDAPSGDAAPSSAATSGLAAITARASRASIPAWQMAAAQRTNSAQESVKSPESTTS